MCELNKDRFNALMVEAKSYFLARFQTYRSNHQCSDRANGSATSQHNQEIGRPIDRPINQTDGNEESYISKNEKVMTVNMLDWGRGEVGDRVGNDGYERPLT